jgi:squalene synthase HpnC
VASSTFLYPKDFVVSAEAKNKTFSLSEAEAYTRWLSGAHYENFHVVSFLLPKELHQDFFNVYAYCRWADDLGDEIGSPEESTRLLNWWRDELLGMYAGHTRHPVFVALAGTVKKHDLPLDPFDDLITAFIQDQTVTRYECFSDLYEYCKYSANPVGRLVLMLCGYRDQELFQLSDATCTGLQLANFWQDVTVDWEKGRCYLPAELLQRHGTSYQEIADRHCSPAFQAAMHEACAYARYFFDEGLPLAKRVDRRLSLDLELFSRGGLAILDKIERAGYNVLTERPAISKTERVSILLKGLTRWLIQRAA